MQEVGNRAFFAGTFTHRIDKKGRISIPARWRSEFRSEESPHLYVAKLATSYQVHAIECVTQSDLRRRNSEQADRTELSQRRRGLLGLHHFHAYSAQLIDPEGRVQLPADTLIASALAEGKGEGEGTPRTRSFTMQSPIAELLGAGDRFYILHPDHVDDFLAEATAEAEAADRRPGSGL